MTDQALAAHRVVGDGPATILFLHGLGGDWSNHTPQLDEFGSDYRCVSWTMPGFGDSPALSALTWSALADSAVALLDAVGADSATVVGLSMGGYVAQQVALDHPDRVNGLVLIGTSSAFGRPGDDTFKTKFLAVRHAPLDEGKTPADLAQIVVDGLVGPDPHPDARTNCIASMTRISTDAYRQALACLVTWDVRDRLHEIDTPTLCIAGSDDKTAPVSSLERLAAAIDGATVEVIDQCGHLVNLERPAEFNSVLRTFLNNRVHLDLA